MVSKALNTLSECPQLWRSAQLFLKRRLSNGNDNEDLKNSKGVYEVCARHRNHFECLSIWFSYPHASEVSEVLASIASSKILTMLSLAPSGMVPDAKEMKQIGILMMCAVARLTALQSLHIYGFAVSLQMT